MSLQARILLAFGYLVLLIVLGAVAAAVGFRDLGTRIGAVLGENFESVQAATGMLEALERQDSAVLELLIGRGARADLEAAEDSFQVSLERARANITLEREPRIIETIRTRFADYRTVRERLLEAAPTRPLEEYEREVFPVFERVKESVRDLIEINDAAMVRADAQAERTATARAAMHGLLVAIAVLSLPPLARMIRRDVLGPVDELASVAEAIAGGDRHRRAPVRHDDELGVVAHQFNAVLDRLQQVERESEALRAERRRLLRALLVRLERPAAVLSPAGRILADTLSTSLRSAVAEAVGKRLEGPLRRGEEAALRAEGARLRLLPLEAGKGPSPGWLVLVREQENDEQTGG